jgi:hypothetical protein
MLRNGLHNPFVILLRACMLRALPNNGRCLQSHRLATGLYSTILLYLKLWDSAVGMATDYGLDGRRFGVRVPVGARFFPPCVVQTDSGAHPSSNPIGAGGSFPGGKAAGELVLRSRLHGSIHPLSHTSSWCSA